MAESKTPVYSAPFLKPEIPTPTTSITVQELLENEPLHSSKEVQDLFAPREWAGLRLPDEIRTHCHHEKCDGVRRHVKHKHSESPVVPDKAAHHFASYLCINCTETAVVFALRAEGDWQKSASGVLTKIYQYPAFGPPIPKRLFQIIGEANRAYFLQARRGIGRGLGIGAYAYYRRIVEDTKFNLIVSVLEVATATNASLNQIQLLEKAKSETQFSKAMEMLRDVSAIPAVLLIDGHDPLSLLHDLLSEGIHQLDDRECLERAQEAEVILCEIAERMQIALTERKTVKAAITSILGRKAKSGTGTTVPES